MTSWLSNVFGFCVDWLIDLLDSISFNLAFFFLLVFFLIHTLMDPRRESCLTPLFHSPLFTLRVTARGLKSWFFTSNFEARWIHEGGYFYHKSLFTSYFIDLLALRYVRYAYRHWFINQFAPSPISPRELKAAVSPFKFQLYSTSKSYAYT